MISVIELMQSCAQHGTIRISAFDTHIIELHKINFYPADQSDREAYDEKV